MIKPDLFYNELKKNDVQFFTGVPDSLLANFCAYVTDNTEKSNHIIAANEGNALGIACGHYMSTGSIPVVYMQNSGIGNAVNPLLSLSDEKVYSIPALLIIGWRGKPGTHDEPQHIKQGELTIELLQALQIEFSVLNDNYAEQLQFAFNYMKKYKKPYALVVTQNTFEKYNSSTIINNNYLMSRETALACILGNIDDAVVVSTTGKASREIYEIRENNNQTHNRDFLTVGSMGHTSSIALGISLETDQEVYCIDGDGSLLMHMGALAILAQNAKPNLKYIVINNGAHESVGGQPTVAFDISIAGILKAVGFNSVYEAFTEQDIKDFVCEMKQSHSLGALVVNVNLKTRTDLGRPSIPPIITKEKLMEILARGDL